MLYRVRPDSLIEATHFRDAFLGESVFLLCPGPSLAEADLALLNQWGLMTFGLNTAAVTFRPRLWLGVDYPECFPLAVYQDPGVMKVSRASIAHLTWPREGGRQLCEYPNIWFVHLRRERGRLSIDGPLFETPARWYPKAFILAIQLAWWLGFRTIYTVGTDFEISPERQYAHGNPLSGRYVATNRGVYANTLDVLRRILPDLAARGVKLVNTTQGGRLDFVERMGFEEAVAEALAGKAREVNVDALLHSMEALRLRQAGFRMVGPGIARHLIRGEAGQMAKRFVARQGLTSEAFNAQAAFLEGGQRDGAGTGSDDAGGRDSVGAIPDLAVGAGPSGTA